MTTPKAVILSAAKNLPGMPARSFASLRMTTGLVIFCLCLVASAQAQELFESAPSSIPSEVEATYLKGLKYLVSTQSSQGNWEDSNGNEPGVVGIAVLAMLAHGDDPNFGPYGASIKKGLDFIVRRADTRTGYIGSSMYHHGFATLALAEAYGAVDDARIGTALEKAVRLILSSQERNGAGAWRYSPESPDADTTVSGAQMMALLAARNAGIAVPEEAIQKGLRFYLQCQGEDGGIGYTGPGGPNQTRTAIGALVFALAKQKDARAYKSAVRFLRDGQNAGHEYPFYHEYYAAQAYFHADAKVWQAWNAQNARRLAATQTTEGSWESNWGQTFATGAALLSLALNYRFLPIYER